MYNDASTVVGNTWNTCNADELIETLDHSWVAGSTHAGETAPAASADTNAVFACYFALEIPKIGRNPNDYNKDYDVTIGARIYADDAATEFTAVPQSQSTFHVGELPSYEVEVVQPTSTGAFNLIATMGAMLVMLAIVF